MTINARLVNLVRYMQEQMASFPDQLPQKMLDKKGKADAWSAKDNLFHALVWAERRLEILETLEKGDEWEDIDYGDFEEVNKEIFLEYKEQSWNDAKDLAKSTYLGILAYLERVNEDVLMGVKGEEERTIWRSIVDNYISHPMIHLWEQLVQAGKIDTLTQMFGEEYFELLLAVDKSENFQGGVFYNRACLLALIGENEKAVEELEKALRMVPALVEWSTQDSDLDSLRELPSFQALYKES